MDEYGTDLFDQTSRVCLRLGDGVVAVEGPRVGVSQAADRMWRFWLPDRPEVSAYRRSPRAPGPGASDYLESGFAANVASQGLCCAAHSRCGTCMGFASRYREGLD